MTPNQEITLLRRCLHDLDARERPSRMPPEVAPIAIAAFTLAVAVPVIGMGTPWLRVVASIALFVVLMAAGMRLGRASLAAALAPTIERVRIEARIAELEATGQG